MKFLESGDLLSSDLASWEGNEDWVPLESLLSSSNESEQTEEPVEDDSLDDFDHEKMKQWEDVFVDDDDDDDEVTSDSDQFIDDDFPDDEVPEPEPASASEEPVQSVPPPLSEASPIPEAPAVQNEQTSEPLPAVTEPPVLEVEQDVPEDLAPPPPPPPPDPPSKGKKKSPRKADSEDSSTQSLTPRSKKIKGLNSRQTVIVVKGQSVFSKIYTASLIFLILLVITCLLAVGWLFLSEKPVADGLKDWDFPAGIYELFNSTDESSGMDRTESGGVLSSLSRFESEKERFDSRRG